MSVYFVLNHMAAQNWMKSDSDNFAACGFSKELQLCLTVLAAKRALSKFIRRLVIFFLKEFYCQKLILKKDGFRPLRPL